MTAFTPYRTVLGPNGLHVIYCPDGTPITEPRAPATASSASGRSGGGGSPALRLDVAAILASRGADRAAWVARQAQRRREREAAAQAAPAGTVLRAWRTSLGWSQREAAERCDLTRGLLADLESGRRVAPITRQRVAGVLRAALADEGQDGREAAG